MTNGNVTLGRIREDWIVEEEGRKKWNEIMRYWFAKIGEERKIKFLCNLFPIGYMKRETISERELMEKFIWNVTSLLYTPQLENIRSKQKNKKTVNSMRKWFACNTMLFMRQEREREQKKVDMRGSIDALTTHIRFFTPKCRTNKKKKAKQELLVDEVPRFAYLDRSIQERIFSYFPTFFSFHYPPIWLTWPVDKFWILTFVWKII